MIEFVWHFLESPGAVSLVSTGIYMLVKHLHFWGFSLPLLGPTWYFYAEKKAPHAFKCIDENTREAKRVLAQDPRSECG